MNDYLAKITEQFSKVYGDLTPRKRLIALTTILLTIGSLVGLIVWANKIDYKPLYSDLSPEDAGAVIKVLRERKVPYKADEGGSRILVPAKNVYDLRFELAAEGVPQSTGIGYEIFDRQSLGVTEFVQKVNFQRALQGELARTITQLEEVKLARVHVTIPKETLFVDEQQKPQASVVLSLESGKMLRDSQIQGITHLVASSVEGMDPDEVIIVDSHGKLISGGQQRLEQVGITSSQQQLQSVTENNLARKIESMLGNVVGHDKVTAKVSVDLNFTQIEQTEESYDPEAAAVRSEQRGSEKSSGRRPIASGIPGVVSNVPETQQSAAAAGVKSVDYNKQDETVNYEISKVIKRTVNQIGAVSRLTVAVLIDGTYVTATDKEGIETSQYTVRSPEEMNKYAALVKQAVGYNEDRGDTVEVVNVQFQEMDLETKSIVGKLVEQIDLQSIITYMITAFLFALFFIFGLRPLMRILSKTFEEQEVVAELPEGAEGSAEAADSELPPGVFAQEGMAVGERQTNLIQFAKKNPRLFAQYLKGWLQ